MFKNDFKVFLAITLLKIDDPQSFGECRTPINESGDCIALNSCEALSSKINETPLTQDTIVFLRNSQCGNYQGVVLVCCPKSSSSNKCNNLPVPGTKACGTFNDKRIYGGNKTAIDDYPWMALLEYTKPNNKKGFHCGGVLINDRYVVTAAHCVKGKDIPSDWSLTSIRLGEWDLSTEVDCDKGDCADPPTDIKIAQVIVHEKYDPFSKDKQNDIAILKLAESVKLTDFIFPICLPRGENFTPMEINGLRLDIAGWGRTEQFKSSDVKLRATVFGITLENCKLTYGREGINIKENQICAGGEKGIDSCRGDSGGPLIGTHLKNRPFYYLLGIVSFGAHSCGAEGWPGVYTNVLSYTDWIESKVC